MRHVRSEGAPLAPGEAGPQSPPSHPPPPALSLNVLIIQFLLIHLFSLLVEFSAAF